VTVRFTHLPQTAAETKLIHITAMAKLADVPKVRQRLGLFVRNNNLEFQQRFGELKRPEVSEGPSRR
jgi:hypothetical protein